MAPKTVPSRPAHGSQLRADRTRAAVIDETIRCIHEEGFGAASARHIAERAGVTWGVIQYHFGDRDGLLTAVVDHAFTELIDTLAELLPESAAMTTRRRTQFVIEAVWAVFCSPNSLAAMEIVIANRSVRDSLATTHLAELLNTFTVLGRHLGDGLAARHSKELGNLIWATLRGLLVVQLTVSSPFDTSRDLQALVEVIVAYIESHRATELARAPRGLRTRRAATRG